MLNDTSTTDRVFRKRIYKKSFSGNYKKLFSFGKLVFFQKNTGFYLGVESGE